MFRSRLRQAVTLDRSNGRRRAGGQRWNREPSAVSSYRVENKWRSWPLVIRYTPEFHARSVDIGLLRDQTY